MGFLLGAFGKQMAAKRVRSLQARMMSVQRRAASVTRQIEQVTKSLESQKRAALTSLSSISAMEKMGASTAQQAQQQSLYNSVFSNFIKAHGGNNFDITKLDKDALAQYNSLNTQYNQQLSQYSSANLIAMQGLEQSISQQKAMLEEQFSAMEDMQLQPLKDEEDALETEKLSLESQLQLAQNDQKACEEMEKNGVKNLVPSYTGGNT